MFITPTQYALTFQEIRRTSLSHSTCKLIIFVSCLNIDAICTAKILSVILRKELIQYQLIPVVGYSDLKTHYAQLDPDISTVILIGCGGLLDLESFFDINVDEFVSVETTNGNIDDVNSDLNKNTMSFTRKIYVIDNHRPWNLENIFGSPLIVCFDDGFIDANLSQEKMAYDMLVNIHDPNETDNSDYNDYGEDDVDSPQNSETNTTDNDIESTDESIVINSDDSDQTIDRKRKQQELKSKKLTKRRRREKNRYEDIIQDYYNQGTTVITSNSATIYALLSLIGETTIENIWLTIIGTSSLDSQFPEVYNKLQPILKEEVFRLNPSSKPNSGNPNARTADTTTLSIERDYQLFLMRHWTLYDSFFYSSHVNSKLNLWTEDGKKKLHKLFAKMGISLAVAQQKWLYMDMRIKRQLPFIFNKYLPMYGLGGIVRDGFIRTFGYTAQLSAMECVESLTALLELDKTTLGDERTQPENIDNNELDIEERIQQNINRKEKAWVNNFWSSWDALSMDSRTKVTGNSRPNNAFKKSKGFDLLMEGLEHAKQIQQIVFRTGMSVLERKLVKNLRLYRLCVLNDGSIPDLSIFNNPLMLAKLGSWIMENLTEIDFVNNSTSLKPFVLASFDAVSDTYLVMGLAPKYPRDMDNSTRARLGQKNEEKQTSPELQTTVNTRLNTFSVAFRQLSETSGAKMRVDSFESSVIEIRKEDLSPFLEKLTLSGLI